MKRALTILTALTLLAACGGTKVERIDTNEVKDLSGKWNDTDSRLVAEEMIRDCLSRPWIGSATTAAGKSPTVIVGTVRNQSHEHINTDTFVEDLQRELINSGKVEFVASKSERGEVRDERLDQDTNAAEKPARLMAKESGADFMLSGAINTVEDKEGGKSVMLYQTNLKLLNMKTNQIAWNGQKKIRSSSNAQGLRGNLKREAVSYRRARSRPLGGRLLLTRCQSGLPGIQAHRELDDRLRQLYSRLQNYIDKVRRRSTARRTWCCLSR